jgi:hypothetical protein
MSGLLCNLRPRGEKSGFALPVYCTLMETYTGHIGASGRKILRRGSMIKYTENQSPDNLKYHTHTAARPSRQAQPANTCPAEIQDAWVWAQVCCIVWAARQSTAQARYTSHSITARTPKVPYVSTPVVPGSARQYVPSSNPIRLGMGSSLLHRCAALW